MPTARPHRRGVAALCVSALALPALAAAPASAVLVDGRQDIRASACPPGAIPDAGYTDVTLGQVGPEFTLAISCLKDYGITLGTTPTTYSPGDTVTRRQMALFLARQLDVLDVYAPDDDAGFVDLALESADVRSAVGSIASAGITLGVRSPDGQKRYDPSGLVRRDQMAAFLNRLQSATAYYDDEVADFPASPSPFPDTGSADVGALAAAGVVAGRADGSYGPAAPVTRAQMAAFLTRQLNAAFGQGGTFLNEPGRNGNDAFPVSTTVLSSRPDAAFFTASGLTPDTVHQVTLVSTDAFESVPEELYDRPSPGSVVSFDASTTTSDAPGATRAAAVADPGTAGAQPGGSVGAQVAVVNGVAPPGGPARSVLATSDATGRIALTVVGNDADVTVTPFVSRAALPGLAYPNLEAALEVDADQDRVPVELFGYATTPAVLGAGTVRDGVDGDVEIGDVVAADLAGNTLVLRTDAPSAEAIRFVYDDDDSFEDAQNGPYADVAAFEAVLTRGDRVVVNAYARTTPSDLSTFEVVVDRPPAATP